MKRPESDSGSESPWRWPLEAEMRWAKWPAARPWRSRRGRGRLGRDPARRALRGGAASRAETA
eukprot:8911282-Heterocapsa_arctica.AAC.1